MDPYEVLGLDRGEDDQVKIRRAYRQMARRYHPDKNKAPDAEERFKRIAKAYKLLSDPKAKYMYDHFGTDGWPHNRAAHWTSDPANWVLVGACALIVALTGVVVVECARPGEGLLCKGFRFAYTWVESMIARG